MRGMSWVINQFRNNQLELARRIIVGDRRGAALTHLAGLGTVLGTSNYMIDNMLSASQGEKPDWSLKNLAEKIAIDGLLGNIGFISGLAISDTKRVYHVGKDIFSDVVNDNKFDDDKLLNKHLWQLMPLLNTTHNMWDTYGN